MEQRSCREREREEAILNKWFFDVMDGRWECATELGIRTAERSAPHGVCIAPGELAASGTIAFNPCVMMVIGERLAGLNRLQLQAFENQYDAASFSRCSSKKTKELTGEEIGHEVPETATRRVYGNAIGSVTHGPNCLERWIEKVTSIGRDPHLRCGQDNTCLIPVEELCLNSCGLSSNPSGGWRMGKCVLSPRIASMKPAK